MLVLMILDFKITVLIESQDGEGDDVINLSNS